MTTLQTAAVNLNVQLTNADPLADVGAVIAVDVSELDRGRDDDGDLVAEVARTIGCHRGRGAELVGTGGTTCCASKPNFEIGDGIRTKIGYTHK